MLLYNIVYITSNLFTAYIVYCFFESFFEKRVKTGWLPWSLLLYFMLTTTVYFAFDIPMLNLITNIAAMFLVTLAYQSGVLKRILATCYIYMLMFASEIMTAVITGKILIQPLQQAAYSNVLGLFISKTISFGIVMLIKNILKARKKDSPPKFVFVAATFIPISTIIVEILCVATPNVKQTHIIITMVLLMSVNAIAFILFDALSASYHQMLTAKVTAKEREYYLNQCELMQKSVLETKRLRHDIANHYSVLQELLNSGQSDNAKRYLSNLMRSHCNMKHLYSQTGNIVVDSIINYKLSSLDAATAVIDIAATIPTELPMDITDLSVILSNLLDNALSAISQLKADRKLSVQMDFQKNMLAIVVANSYGGALSYLNGKLISTKKEKGEHGLGIQNIQYAVEKYDGLFHISHDSNIFTAEVLLYLPNSLR